MSFRTNKTNQLSLNDSFLNCSERTAKAIKSSWAGNFYEVIIFNINEEKYSVLYSDHEASRPNTPINVIIGSLILKEVFHLSDEWSYIGMISFKTISLQIGNWKRFT